MASPRVAVDMDSTLADTMTTVYERNGYDHTYADQTHWDFPIEAFGSVDSFLHAIEKAWSEEWHKIPPSETRVSDALQRLSNHADVDIVTAQPNLEAISAGKRAWLAAYKVPYENLVTVPLEQTKAELGYDVYIDDKPDLPSRCNGSTCYLRDRPYNRDAGGSYHRVSSVSEAVDHFTA